MYTGFANDKQETMSVSTAAGADAVRHMKGTLVKARKPPIFLKACRKFEPLFISICTSWLQRISLCKHTTL